MSTIFAGKGFGIVYYADFVVHNFNTSYIDSPGLDGIDEEYYHNSHTHTYNIPTYLLQISQ